MAAEAPYFHACCVVANLEQAMDELTAAIGIQWQPTRDRASGDMRWRVVYSVAGPPFIELVEGQPGTPWHTPEGSQLHHIGRFTEDLDAGIATIEAAGGQIEIDGRDISGRWVYMRVPQSGALVELIEADDRGQERFWARIAGSEESA
jgi:glyoxalase/bleomycin resistance protein/dioxygenase superfamily protein